MPTHTIDVADETDRWQWVCPTQAEHRTWEAWNGYFRCIACERDAAGEPDADRDGLYQKLKNVRTGEVVERAELEIVDSAGGDWRSGGTA